MLATVWRLRLLGAGLLWTLQAILDDSQIMLGVECWMFAMNKNLNLRMLYCIDYIDYYFIQAGYQKWMFKQLTHNLNYIV